MKFFSTQDHMGLEISKRFSSYSFHLMSAKLYKDISYHGGIQTITFFGNRPSFKNFVVLWNFNMGSQWENLKCGISRKQLIIDQNGRKFGTQGSVVHIWKVLLMPNSFSLVWGHSVHFRCNFQFYHFQKLHSSPNFHQIHPNFIQSIIIIQAVTFLAIGQKLPKLWHFEIFFKQDHMVL